MLQNFLMATLLGLYFPLASIAQDEFVPVEESAAANMLGATNVAPVYFRQTQEILTLEEKKALQAFVTSARSKGTVLQAKVLAWADREYPLSNDKASTEIQKKLADSRAENIRKFLNDQLDVNEVSIFNMSERPSSKDELLKSEDYVVKHTMEITGVVPKPDETGVFNDLGKGSSALVFLKVEGKRK